MPKNANVREGEKGDGEGRIARKVLALANAQSSDQQEAYKIHERY